MIEGEVHFHSCVLSFFVHLAVPFPPSHFLASSLPPLPLSPSISYTSLDGVEDTRPNSYLAVSTETEVGRELTATGRSLPAYTLANEEHEREGRGRA